MNQRPNILHIQSDQHRFDCLGVNGHPFVRTPAFDQLAAEGINFTHAFTPIPLCVPARNSLLHGMWSTQHLCIANYETEAPRPPDDKLVSFTALLRQTGYHLDYVGKWHVSENRGPLDYGFNSFIDSRDYLPWRESVGLSPRVRKNGWFGQVDYNSKPEQSRLAWGADHAIERIAKAAEHGAPFYIRWDPPEPHLPNIVPEPYAGMYPPESIPPWPSFPDDLYGKPYAQAQQRRTWKVDGWSWKEWSEIVGRYLGEISLLDKQIGRLLATLDDLDISENTMVIYSTDHGDMCGAHGMIDKHFVMYDDVVRVPLIIRWPDRITPGSVCDDFVSNAVDLGPTICTAAAIETPAGFAGHDLLNPIGGKRRKDIFSTYHGNLFGLYTQRMVRNKNWKYIWNATAEDELYDLVNDPAELHNLAGVSEYLPQMSLLRKRLLEWMEEVDDPLFNNFIRAQLDENLSV